MSLDALNDAVANTGGKWAKLRTVDDPKLVGTLLDFEKRGKTFEGQPVLSRKSGDQRVEWNVTLQTDERNDPDDDGIRKFSANESAQRAIADAIRKSGRQAEIGGTLKVAVTQNPENDREQATYTAVYEPPPSTAPVSADDIFAN